MQEQAPIQFDAYFTVLENDAQQIDHENWVNIISIHFKQIINYLDLTPSIAELSIAKAQAKPAFKPCEDVQDPNTLYVPYESFIKLPPQIKSLICEAQKAESGNQPCKVNFQDVYGTTSDDLAPDIMPVEQSFYEAEGNEDAALDDNVEDDRQLLAHLTCHKEQPPSDIWHVLASQQSKQEQQVMQCSASANKPKKIITIDGIVYTANVHNIDYSISEHCANKKETSLVDCGANGRMAGDDVMVVERGEHFATVNGIDGHPVQDLLICTFAALVWSNKRPIIVNIHQYA